MKRFVSAAAVALIVGLGSGPAAHAAVIDFAVSVLDGASLKYTGATLDQSSAFNFDGASLLVSALGPGDDSGLTPFPGPADTVTLSPTDIMYGSGMGGGSINVTKTWTAVDGDQFTEMLTTVKSINRGTANAITVALQGTVSDTDHVFTNQPVSFIFSANQVGGPNTAISAGFTNTTLVIPEPATWVMMGLGFAALGYAAVRRSSKDKSAFSI